MPRKGATKANAKGAIADGSLVLNSNTPTGQTTPGPTRGGSSTRGAKRRRTSNNVTNSSTEIYGSGTIVAANPFDDDHHSSTHHPHPHPHHPHPHQQQHLQHPHLHPHHSPMLNSTTTSKMMPIQPQQSIHHPQQPQPTAQMHPIYSPNYMQQQQPMSIPPHSHHHMSTPPGQMPGPPMQDHHLGPAGQQHPPPPMPHPVMHNHGHIMQQPVQQHQNYAPPSHANPTTQMIGTSTPPHMMGPGPAPSHSPYMHQPQPPQQQQHQQGSMLAPPHQAMTPQPQPHLDQMLMQQQPYAMNSSIYCGKCQREVYQNEPNIICKAGCRSCFHIACSGLTQLACDLLMKESLAEWACDRCTSGNRRVPFVKYKT